MPTKKTEDIFIKPDGEAVEVLVFKWDKKSGGSTNSLLESDSSDSYSNSNASTARDKLKSSMSNKDLTTNEIVDKDFTLEDLRKPLDAASSPESTASEGTARSEKLEQSIKVNKKTLDEPPSISPQPNDLQFISEREASVNEKVDKYLKELNDLNNVDPTIAVKSKSKHFNKYLNIFRICF